MLVQSSFTMASSASLLRQPPQQYTGLSCSLSFCASSAVMFTYIDSRSFSLFASVLFGCQKRLE
jgi:hypothetical protein